MTREPRTLGEEAYRRFERLAELVHSSEKTGRWLVLMHDNPDPDALASGGVLAHLLRAHFRRPVTLGYGGIIGRAENQSMVQQLGLRPVPRRRLQWRHYKHIALVDCQPFTGNTQLPEGIEVDMVFDHHPPRPASRKVRYCDIRPDYGATATLLAEYLLASGLEPSRRDATAVVFAIRTETRDFGREASGPDRWMHDYLLPLIDKGRLAKIQHPRLPLGYFETLHAALGNLEGVGNLAACHLGVVDQPDIVPEVADLVVRLRGKTWSLTSGVFEDRLYLSIRTTNARADAGRLMVRLLGRRGKGGGHGTMAGGWVALGASGRAPQDLHRLFARRLARYLKKNPDKLLPILGREAELPSGE